jgi:hypothetical protein
MCTDAYRAALTLNHSSTASSVPTAMPATSQHQAAEGQDDLDSRDIAAAPLTVP